MPVVSAILTRNIRHFNRFWNQVSYACWPCYDRVKKTRCCQCLKWDFNDLTKFCYWIACINLRVWLRCACEFEKVFLICREYKKVAEHWNEPLDKKPTAFNEPVILWRDEALPTDGKPENVLHLSRLCETHLPPLKRRPIPTWSSHVRVQTCALAINNSRSRNSCRFFADWRDLITFLENHTKNQKRNLFSK